jgi:GT2 family glycosyltransferase
MISVAIPTWRRTQTLRHTLDRILACRPRPLEILVHVDAGDAETRRLLEPVFKAEVRWFESATTQGPGGGRNLLLRSAASPLVAGFDDDSWPLDSDYFAVAESLAGRYPDAAVFNATEIRPGAEVVERGGPELELACFQNGACVVRSEAVLETRGFLPLRFAYGMEEADVALQLIDRGWRLLHSPALRVYHDSKLEHHASAAVNAAHICNTALLAYLRYPYRYWPLGMVRVINRVRYALKQGRYRGIMAGMFQIPRSVWKYRAHRAAVAPDTIRKSRLLAGVRGS